VPTSVAMLPYRCSLLFENGVVFTTEWPLFGGGRSAKTVLPSKSRTKSISLGCRLALAMISVAQNRAV